MLVMLPLEKESLLNEIVSPQSGHQVPMSVTYYLWGFSFGCDSFTG